MIYTVVFIDANDEPHVDWVNTNNTDNIQDILETGMHHNYGMGIEIVAIFAGELENLV